MTHTRCSALTRNHVHNRTASRSASMSSADRQLGHTATRPHCYSATLLLGHTATFTTRTQLHHSSANHRFRRSWVDHSSVTTCTTIVSPQDLHVTLHGLRGTDHRPTNLLTSNAARYRSRRRHNRPSAFTLRLDNDLHHHSYSDSATTLQRCYTATISATATLQLRCNTATSTK